VSDDVRPGRRLTVAQRELAETAFRVVPGVVTRVVPPALVRAFGRDHWEQEGRLACCIAAAEVDPVRHPGVPFPAFAANGVRLWLWGQVQQTARTAGVWRSWPANPETGEPHPGPADRRRPAADPALRLWCSAADRDRRRRLDWRTRVVLYLMCVEGWTQAEVGRAIGVKRARVGQLVERAVERLNRHEGATRWTGPTR